jgi:hypothetical protein
MIKGEGSAKPRQQKRPFYIPLKYRSVTDIVRPIREIVRRREETTGTFCPTKVKLRFIVCPTQVYLCPTELLLCPLT